MTSPQDPPLHSPPHTSPNFTSFHLLSLPSPHVSTMKQLIGGLADAELTPSLVLLLLFRHRAFDVELLYIAQCFKIPIGEVAVNWTEIEGT